jgi:cytochrome c-type biogenesis protein CcmH/NrfG
MSVVSRAAVWSSQMSFPPLSWLRSSTRSTAGILGVAALVFLVVAGIGAGSSYWKNSPKATGAGRANDETLARLENYTRALGSEPGYEQTAHTAASDKALPDVNTMIERLAARLQTAPDDLKGWRMLGWSYFHTGRYEQAATALARAMELDSNSTDLKAAYEAAKAKASGKDDADTASSSQAEAAGKPADGARPEHVAQFETMTVPERDTAIRSMVDGLANRLERSPRDVEGWTRLMRSRVVLGQREVAATALRKALEVFKDDQAASGRITAAAIELGLKAE